MGESPKNKKHNPWPDAIIGGMFGVAVGWFYKREATQSVMKQVKESDLARNIATDVYNSTQNHLRDTLTKSFESKTNNVLQNHSLSPTDDEKDDNSEEEKENNSSDEKEQSYEALKKENEQLDEMISYLEKKFEKLS